MTSKQFIGRLLAFSRVIYTVDFPPIAQKKAAPLFCTPPLPTSGDRIFWLATFRQAQSGEGKTHLKEAKYFCHHPLQTTQLKAYQLDGSLWAEQRDQFRISLKLRSYHRFAAAGKTLGAGSFTSL